MAESALKEQIRKKHAELEDKNKSLDLLPVDGESALEIAFADLAALTGGLKSGRFSSHQIVSVYVARALAFGRRYCWTADTLYAEALATAKECDALLKVSRENGDIEALFAA